MFPYGTETQQKENKKESKKAKIWSQNINKRTNTWINMKTCERKKIFPTVLFFFYLFLLIYTFVLLLTFMITHCFACLAPT